jgi:hypothetical protein
MPRYFSYIRFSSAPQEEGDSEERQLRHGRERAAELKAEFVDAYTDRGASGWTGKNQDGALGRMIEGVQSGKIKPGDIIGVENHDRLTRRPPLEAIELFIAFLNAGIVLDINGNVRTKEILNAALGFGLLVQDLIEMFRAYQESQRKSEFGIKTNLNKREGARNGERRVMKAGAGCFVGRRCPAWLRPLGMPSPKGHLYEIIEDAPDQPWRGIVRRALLMADAGHGVGTIAKRFNDEQVPPLEVAHRLPSNSNQRRKKRPVSIKWTAGMVWQLIRNAAIIGEYQPYVVKEGKRGDAGLAIKGYYPPLFPDDPGIYYRVRDAMKARDKAGGKGRNGRNYANIIKGTGRCACCDGVLTLHTSSGRLKAEGVGREIVYYLRCDNARQGVIFPKGHKLAGQKCPNGKGFPYALFESLLFRLFDPCMEPVLAGLTPDVHRDDLLQRRVAETEAGIQQSERALDRLYAIIKKPDTSDSLIERTDRDIRQVDAELTRLKQERERLQERVKAGEASNPAVMAERVRAARAKLGSNAPQERHDARVKIHDLLRDRIGVRLHQDRRMVVIMKGFDTNADMLGMMFTPDGVLHVHKVNEMCTKIKSQLTPDEIGELNQAIFPRVA